MTTALVPPSVRPSRDPLTVTVNDALAMIGIGRTKFYAMVASGQITTITIGRRRLVSMASLRRLAGEGQAAKAVQPVKPHQLQMRLE